MRAMVTSIRAPLPTLAAPIACGCCLLAGVTYIGLNNPSDGGVFLPCPFRTLTGWWCPGCGLTRATHHLVNGNVMQALHFNVFVIVILAAIAGSWLSWLLITAGRSMHAIKMVPSWAYWVAGATILTFTVVRNLPGVTGLRG